MKHLSNLINKIKMILIVVVSKFEIVEYFYNLIKMIISI